MLLVSRSNIVWSFVILLDACTGRQTKAVMALRAFHIHFCTGKHDLSMFHSGVNFKLTVRCSRSVTPFEDQLKLNRNVSNMIRCDLVFKIRYTMRYTALPFENYHR